MFTYDFEGSLVCSDKELGRGELEELAPRFRSLVQMLSARGSKAASIRFYGDGGTMSASEEPEYTGGIFVGSGG